MVELVHDHKVQGLLDPSSFSTISSTSGLMLRRFLTPSRDSQIATTLMAKEITPPFLEKMISTKRKIPSPLGVYHMVRPSGGGSGSIRIPPFLKRGIKGD